MIKAVLFDLDGTLVNSLEDLAEAVNYALQNKRFPTHTLEKYNDFVSYGISELIERAVPEYARTAELLSEVQELFFEHYSAHFADKTYAYPGIKQLISGISDMGIKTAVVTNKAHFMAEKVVESVFGKAFNIVLGAKEEIPAKPDPTLAYDAMSFLDVSPEKCVFVGDSEIDMATGINCGALPIGVLWGFRSEELLRSNGAKYIIKNPDELFKIIGGV